MTFAEIYLKTRKELVDILIDALHQKNEFTDEILAEIDEILKKED